MNTKERIEVMQAYLDGKAIEVKNKIDHKWVRVWIEPQWDWSTYEYRIKPKKMQKIEKLNPGHEINIYWIYGKINEIVETLNSIVGKLDK